MTIHCTIRHDIISARYKTIQHRIGLKFAIVTQNYCRQIINIHRTNMKGLKKISFKDQLLPLREPISQFMALWSKRNFHVLISANYHKFLRWKTGVVSYWHFNGLKTDILKIISVTGYRGRLESPDSLLLSNS